MGRVNLKVFVQHGWVLGTAMRNLCMFSEWDGRPADETGLAVQFMVEDLQLKVLRFSMLGLCGCILMN